MGEIKQLQYGLTGLAQSKVVRITPMSGVTEMIFEVNLGKSSFANTTPRREVITILKSMISII